MVFVTCPGKGMNLRMVVFSPIVFFFFSSFLLKKFTLTRRVPELLIAYVFFFLLLLICWDSNDAGSCIILHPLDFAQRWYKCTFVRFYSIFKCSSTWDEAIPT